MKTKAKKYKDFDFKRVTLQLKDNFKLPSRNFDDTEGGTIEELSTISPHNAQKNILNDGDISIKFTDDNRKDMDEKFPNEVMPEIKPSHLKTQSQKIKTIIDLDKRYHKPPRAEIKPTFEGDDMEPLTFNEYISCAKMAKEQKHLLATQPSRSLSKKKLLNFIRPMSTKDTPVAKNKLDIQAEFNVQNLLKCKIRKKKTQEDLEDDKYISKKRRNFNYKTPPPELANAMHFAKRH